jgi:hypothetical protein
VTDPTEPADTSRPAESTGPIDAAPRQADVTPLADVTPPVEPAMPAIDLDLAVPTAATPARRRAPVFVAAGLTLLLLIGGGIGYQALSGGDRRPEQFTPASVAAFAAIDLDPGLGQQLSLLRLAKKLPASAGVGRAGNAKAFIAEVLGKLHLEGVDVGRDLTSWLGLRAGVSAWTDDQKRTYALISAVSTDDAAATKGLRHIADTVQDTDIGFVVHDGTVLIAIGDNDADAAAQAAAAEAKRAPLGELDSFRQAREWLDNDPVLLVWTDLARVRDSVLAGLEETGMSSSLDPAKALKGTMILGVRATDDGIEARYRTFGAGREQSLASDALSRLGKLPGNSNVGAALSFPKDFGLDSMSSFAGSGLALGGLPLLFGGFASSSGNTSAPTLEVPSDADQAELTKLLSKDPSTLTKAEQERIEELIGSQMPAHGSCGTSWSTDGLDAAEVDKLDELMKKDPQKLTKAERKELKEMLGFDPAECETMGWGGPNLSEADAKELDKLMSKDPATLTASERKRYKELTGMDPDQFGPTFGGGEPFNALAGASVDVAVSSLDDHAGARINATVDSPDKAKTLASLVETMSVGTSEGLKATIQGSTVTATSPSYLAGTGTLADQALYRRAMPDFSGGASVAFFVDLSALPAEDRPSFPITSVGLIEGADGGDMTGAVRILVG